METKIMKHLLFTRVLCLCTLFTFFSCGTPDKDSKIGASTKDPETFDLGILKDTIRLANERYVKAVTTGDTITAADSFTSDAKIMAPNMPALTSRDDIIRFLGMTFRMGVTAKIETINIWGTEDLVAEEGTFVMYDKSGKQFDTGKFLALWKKEAGRWGLFRDMFSSNSPAVASN